jgi:mono/diheme cytochrome c family protein
MKKWITSSLIGIGVVAGLQVTVGGVHAGLLAEHSPSAVRALDRSVWDSVFTAAQAARGDSLYKGSCANCHGAALQGGTTPTGDDAAPLVGPAFMASWDGQTLGDLYDKIFSAMPVDKPKTLDKQLIVDVMAHILNQNHFPAGSKELETDIERLKEVKFVPVKPAH